MCGGFIFSSQPWHELFILLFRAKFWDGTKSLTAFVYNPVIYPNRRGSSASSKALIVVLTQGRTKCSFLFFRPQRLSKDLTVYMSTSSRLWE